MLHFSRTSVIVVACVLGLFLACLGCHAGDSTPVDIAQVKTSRPTLRLKLALQRSFLMDVSSTGRAIAVASDSKWVSILAASGVNRQTWKETRTLAHLDTVSQGVFMGDTDTLV